MSALTLFLGIMPLLLFVVIDSVSGVKAAVIAAIFFAFLELLYTIIIYKTIDNITIVSSLMVAVFGFLSFRSNKPIYMKLQPVVLGVIFGIVLLTMQMIDKPLMVLMVEKYQYLLPEQFRELATNQAYLAMLSRLSLTLAFGFLIHAALVAYAAFFMNKWWWIIIRGIGLYVMLALCTLYVRFT